MNASLPPNIFALINTMEGKGITLSLRENDIYPYYPSLELMAHFDPFVRASKQELVFAYTLRQLYRNQQVVDGVRSR